MVIHKTPFQSFKLELTSIADCVDLVARGTTTREGIAHALGMGEKKIEGMFEWAEFLGLIVGRPRTTPQELTILGAALASKPGFADDLTILQVLYAMIAVNHPLVNGLVNSFLYDVSRQVDPTFDKASFKSALLSASQGFNVNPVFLTKRSRIYLDLLSDPANLGRNGVVTQEPDGKRFRVASHRPDWRAAGYLLYSMWPEGVSRVRIGEVVSAKNSLGRIFCLLEAEVMVLLSKLEQERVLALEMIADLHQIGLNPAMTAQDYLEMLVHGHE